MTTPKKPRPSRPERAYRTEIDVAHATLDRVPDLIGRGHNLTARVAAVVQRLDETKARVSEAKAREQSIAVGSAEFINAIAEVFDLPVPTDREPTAALMLAKLREVAESARAARHNLHVAEGTIATLTGERDTAMSANLALRCELDAAVKAMGKPDARASDDVATIAALAAICENIGPDDGQTAKHYVELAREAARAARGMS